MFRIPSKVLDQLYDSDCAPAEVLTSRYKYLLFRDVFRVGSCSYDAVQRVSLSDSSDCDQRLLTSWYV